MASDSESCGSASSDEETVPVFKKRKYKSIMYSSDSDDTNSDVERKPKSKRKPQPLCESDSELADNSAMPLGAACSSNSSEYACGGNVDNEIPDSPKKAAAESSDSDEQSEKCPICLSKFTGQDIGTPESCDHSFCLECLQEWAKKVNTCPVDRLHFNLILVRQHLEGKIVQRICVETKEFVDEDDEDTDSSFYDIYCEVCGENDNEERLLLCDDCDLAYHCECLNPPLSSIPRGLWCCPSCTAMRNGETFLPSSILPDLLEVVSTRFRPYSLTLAGRNFPRTYADQVYHRIHQQHGAARTAPVHRVPGDMTPHPRRSPVLNRTYRPIRPSPLTFSNSSSSESSDENVEYTRNTGRRRHCPEVRSRRQNRLPQVLDTAARRVTSKHSSRSSSGQQFAMFSSFSQNETGTSALLAVDSDDDSFEYSYEEGGLAFAQASAVHHRTNHRVKESLSRNAVSGTSEVKPSSADSCPSPLPSSCDILGGILQTQAVLHSPTDFVVIKRDGSLTLTPPSNTQQRPLNPMHHSPVKSSGTTSQNSGYTGNSASSSSVSGSSHYYGVCNVQKPVPADHSTGGGFDREPYSVMASRSHYNPNLVDDFKKGSFDPSHNKESKPNSDDEVDIYSDIESVGDTETQMDDDMEDHLKHTYKCDESQINNNDDGTDSSENELVIDEDVQAEEEGEKQKDDFDGVTQSSQPYEEHNSEVQGSEGSVCSDLADSYSDNQENLEVKPNSPGSREEDSRDACISPARHSSSQDGFQSSDVLARTVSGEEQEDTQNEAASEAQNDTDSDDSARGENSLDGDADEENSLDSAKGALSDAVSDQASKEVTINPIASPSEHSRSAEEEEQPESKFLSENHFTEHSDDRQVCEEQDSKSGSEAMDAENEAGEDEHLEVDSGAGTEEHLEAENEDSMECEDKEQDANDQEMVDNEPCDSSNKDLSENIQSGDESDNHNDVESDLGDHEDAANDLGDHDDAAANDLVEQDSAADSNMEVYVNDAEGELKDISEQEDGNVSEDDFHDQVEEGASANPEEEPVLSSEMLHEPHSSEPKGTSEPDGMENLENSSGSTNDACGTPEQESKECYEHNDVSNHFEEVQEEYNKSEADDNFNLQNEHNMIETECTKQKVTDQEDTMNSHNTDLGIEDISDAASDDLNQSECAVDASVTDGKDDEDAVRQKQKEMDDVEKNVARLFEQDSSSSDNKTPTKSTFSKRSDESGKYHSASKHSSQSNDEDQEEGEIIEDPPVRKKPEKHDHKIDYGHDDVDDYIDMTPRLSISDLPRIPKIKRDRSKADVPEDIPLELKRTSVLGRVDLGSTDISWKRLSKHTRERSYRDGRHKDERLLYREREVLSKDKKSCNESDRKAEEKYRESDRRRDDGKKQEFDKVKEKSQRDHARDRKSEKSKESYEKSAKSRDWSYGSQEKREREKQHDKSYKERYERDRYDREKERHERGKDRHDKEKDRYKGEDRYEREKDRDDERFDRDEERFERVKHDKEKCREKERKHKHKDKDRRSENSGKDGSQSKHKRSHSREHFCEKQKEREVRKIDDKLKIVVEHKDLRKDKLEKHVEKKESKHDKKYKEDGHRHHEHRKKERTLSPYKELTPIESKEIFAKGDSIIINVNFSRSSSKGSDASVEDPSNYTRDSKKSSISDIGKGDHLSATEDLRTGKLKHSLVEKERTVEISGTKRPSTPPERTDTRSTQVLSVGESYWQETDDVDIKSPPEDKCLLEKPVSDDDDDERSVDAFGGDDHYSDSDDEPATEIQATTVKVEAETESTSGLPEQDATENSYSKESDNYTCLRKRSPHPPSPPSPPDNDDSYDPCEPTRSPSPPPSSPVPPAPPLTSLEKPKPPPSPELPPLPPEPEPTDALVREDPRGPKLNPPCPPPDFLGTTSVSSPVSTQPVLYTSNNLVATVPLPNIRVPPPNFIPHSVGRNVQAVPPQLMPPRTMNWQVNNAPSMLYPSNQVPQVIRGTFVQAAVQSPSTASVVSQMGTMLPPGNTIPVVSQVRHLQMNAHANISGNSMMPSVPLSHLNLAQMPISSLGQPPPGMSNSVLNQHSNVSSAQNTPSSFSVSVQNQATSRTVVSQSQLTSISTSAQNQSHVSSPVPNQTSNLPASSQSQSRQLLPPTTSSSLSASLKMEKSCKYPSPPNDKTEVVDMDVDSPYSPGDSPSMDSAYDYSPPSSPLVSKSESTSKDPFDNLLGAGHKSSRHSDFGTKLSSERASRSKLDHFSSSSKRQKVDHKSDSTKVRHSVRLQLTDKGKSASAILKEKLADKRDVLKKLDESQLKILDELPSSAVEMQVKEKFLKKLNRQERVIEEVKLALKPYYTRREINKDEYKDVLRKSVPKICHNKTGEINPVKVKTLVEGYIKKVKYLRKKAGRRSKSSKVL